MFTINRKRSAAVLAVSAGLLAAAVPAGASAAERDGSVPRSTLTGDSNDVIIETWTAGGNATSLDYHGQPVVTYLDDYMGQPIVT